MTSASISTTNPHSDFRLVRHLGPHFRVRLGLASNAFPDELSRLAQAAQEAGRHQDGVLEAVKRMRDDRCERGEEEAESGVTAEDILAAAEEVRKGCQIQKGKRRQREVSDDEEVEDTLRRDQDQAEEAERYRRKRTTVERDNEEFGDEERITRHTSPREGGRVGQLPGRRAATVDPQAEHSAHRVSTSHPSNLSAMDRLVISSFESMSAGAALALEEGQELTFKIGRRGNGRYYFTHQIQEGKARGFRVMVLCAKPVFVDRDPAHNANRPVQAPPVLAPFYPQHVSRGFAGGALWTGSRTPQYPQRWLPSVAPPAAPEGW